MDRHDVDELRSVYRADGVVHVPGLLDADGLALALAAYEWSLANPGPAASRPFDTVDGAFYQDLCNPVAPTHEVYQRVLHGTPVAALVARLFGDPQVWFMYEQVFLKEGGATRRTPWHQDLSYLSVAGDDLAVVWITFDAVPQHDSLEFVRGSHRGTLFNTSAFVAGDETAPIHEGLPRLPDVEADTEGDDTNQRVWNLASREPAFLDLVEHPLALAFVREVLGWPALLSNISANITGPGGGEMGLHADQGHMPEPWGRIQGINMAWCLDGFTEANGGTRIVPGSHRLNRTPTADEQFLPTVALEAPAGSMVVMEGRLWHRTGDNATDDEHRAGVFAWYTLPTYLPQENWWLSLDPSVRQFGNDTLLTLFGFKAGGFGQMNGISPD